MIDFKTAILLLFISASGNSAIPKNQTRRGFPCFWDCDYDYYGNDNDYNYDSRGGRSGLIVLHGLGGGTSGPGICDMLKEGMGLDSSVQVVCPQAEWTTNSLLPLLPSKIQSWFDLFMMSRQSVQSTVAGESITGLQDAMRRVENQIKKLVKQGIPSENIVLAGISQGGSLALYTALRTKYKLGGIIGIVTWLPLIKVEPPTRFNPVNRNTPLLHINGGLDQIVPSSAGRATARELGKVIRDYTFKLEPWTTHATTLNPITIPKITKWLKSKGLLKFGLIGGLINSTPDLSDYTPDLSDFSSLFGW